MFSQLNKTKFLQCCEDSDYRNRNDVVIFTYYYNHAPVPKPIKDFDTEEYHTPRPISMKARHITHWDEAFTYPPFRKKLDELFPKRSKYEANDMTDGYDISIIIPCYNSEQYLKDCVDSVINNGTRYSVEIVCANDGSSDSTPEILDDYSKKYKNIKVVDMGRNTGLSHVRNTCIEKATGRYVYFLDSDDRIAKGGIDKMVSAMDKDSLEIMSVNAQAFFDTKEMEKKYARYLKYYNRPKLPRVMTGKDALRYFFSKGDNNNASCLYVHRRSFLVDINAKFVEGIYYEDAPFNMYVMLSAKRVCNITDKIYERRVREGSIVTMKKSFKHFRSYVIATLKSAENIMLKCGNADGEVISYLMKFQVLSHFGAASNIYKFYGSDPRIFDDMKKYQDGETILRSFICLSSSRKRFQDFISEYKRLTMMGIKI